MPRNAPLLHSDAWFTMRLPRIHRRVELPLQGLKYVDFYFCFFFSLRFLTSARYSRDVEKVFMSSLYKNGLDRLGRSRCWCPLWVIIHIPWSEHSSHEIQPCGHITSPDCFPLAGLRLFAIFITCITGSQRARFSAALPHVTDENLQPVQCRWR